ncbi:hypothetical protein EMIT0P12_50140 [Pseudomonas sp. IT-P12]
MDNLALLDLLRPFPAVDVLLASTTDRQLGFIHILRDGRSGCGGRAAGDIHRRHQRIVGTDEHVFTHHGFPLVHTVIVAGDGTRTDVGPRTDLGIPQITQVASLGPFAQMRVFQFDKVTHMRARFQHGTRTQAGERPGIAAFTEHRAIEVAVGLDHNALAQGTVLDHAIRADHHIVFNDHLAFEDHVDVDQHIAADADFTAHIEACRITQGHPLRHQAACGTQLIITLELGQLLAIVGALHFHGIVGLLGSHHQPIVDRHGNHVGQVVLALGIVIGQTAHPAAHLCERQRQNAGVAFGDRTFGFVGVFLLDDGRDLARRIANDAAVTGRVVQFHGQQTQLLRRDFLQQALKGLDFDQRHIAIENQHGVGFDVRHRLSNRVTRTELFVLQNEIQVIRRQAITHGIGTMADDHVDALWIKLPRTVDNMAKHRIAGNRVQDLWQRRAHTSALASGEDNDFKRHDWLPILGGQRLRPT